MRVIRIRWTAGFPRIRGDRPEIIDIATLATLFPPHTRGSTDLS